MGTIRCSTCKKYTSIDYDECVSCGSPIPPVLDTLKQENTAVPESATNSSIAGYSKGEWLFAFAVFLVLISIIFGRSCINEEEAPREKVVVASDPKDLLQCGGSAKNIGKTYRVIGSKLNIRKGPGAKYEKVVNKKLSRMEKETQYVTIDNTVTVFEECSQGEWSKIRVVDPDYLSASHRGWMASRYLRRRKMDSTGTEIFTEADFVFDKKTMPYKKIIVSGVNKIYREHSQCKDIDASSAYISGSRGIYSNPIFYVACGSGAQVVNVFFSEYDIDHDVLLSPEKRISRSRAITLCKDYAKLSATHPSTVDFSIVLDLSVYEAPNGRTRVASSFTARNSFDMELKFDITCLFDRSGLIEANINEKS